MRLDILNYHTQTESEKLSVRSLKNDSTLKDNLIYICKMVSNLQSNINLKHIPLYCDNLQQTRLEFIFNRLG